MFTVKINLSNIYNNAHCLRKYGILCAVVKANAYGHGAVKVAKTIEETVECFAVATEFEALELAESGIKKDIIVFCMNDYSMRLPQNIIPTVWNKHQVLALNENTNRIAIKVNTGMNRYGCETFEVKSLYKFCAKKHKTAHSVYSHFYNASNFNHSSLQYQKFLSSVSDLPSTVIKHIASTSAIKHGIFSMDMIRVGLGLYGYGIDGVIPSMKVYTKIMQINKVRSGEHIGYGNFVANKRMKIATLRMGYADGVFRNFNKIYFTVNGKRCPVIGTPCMDACFIDISDVKAKEGDDAILLQSSEDMKRLCEGFNTIPYEILTSFGAQRKRSLDNE